LLDHWVADLCPPLADVEYFKAASSHGEDRGVVMRADYGTPEGVATDRYRHVSRSGVDMRLYAVPSPIRAAVERALLADALPVLRSWLEWLASSGSHRDVPHTMIWTWDDGHLDRQEK
jgi:hypothetical protein